MVDTKIKYIDADKLIAELRRQKYELELSIQSQGDYGQSSHIVAYENIISHITSLQQEQPELSNEFEIAINRRLNLINGENLTATELLEETKGMAAELLDLARKVIEKEQPEVALEKFTEKIKTFQARYKNPESISIKGAMAFMARMFYQYPNVARQWYDGLPKATMDDARKEE